MKLTSDGTRFKQRDIVLLPFPYSDLTGAKQRPALIVSNEKLKSNDLICCMITSKKPEEGILVRTQDCDEGYLPFESYIKPYRLFTVHKGIIKKKICKVSDEFFDNVVLNLSQYLKRK